MFYNILEPLMKSTYGILVEDILDEVSSNATFHSESSKIEKSNFNVTGAEGERERERDLYISICTIISLSALYQLKCNY